MSIVAHQDTKGNRYYPTPEGNKAPAAFVEQFPEDRREIIVESYDLVNEFDFWEKKWSHSERYGEAKGIVLELMDIAGLTPAETLEVIERWYSGFCEPIWPREKWEKIIAKVAEEIARERLKEQQATYFQPVQQTAAPKGVEVEIPVVQLKAPEPPGPAAFHGLAGAVVEAILPHSEADPVALLIQTLVAFGSCIGRTAYWSVEGDRHYTNLNAVLVGATSKGRKGSSWGQVCKLFRDIDEEWSKNCVTTGGLSSAEGLLYAVRDPSERKKKTEDGESVEVDPGVTDKRLLCLEPEFASPLKRMEQQGNTLSSQLRQCWDSPERMKIMVKNNPTKATRAHVSMIAHVTAEEVRRYLAATEQANGMANRFLWCFVKRSKSLAEGGQPNEQTMSEIAEAFQQVVAWARQQEEIGFDDEGRAAWHEAYSKLSEAGPGLAGAMLNRAEAQVRRLACIYALMGESPVVRKPHLDAALALWKYTVETVHYVFGDSLGNPDADSILFALKASPGGLTRNDIRREVFQGHCTSTRVAKALQTLLSQNLAHCKKEKTDGRSLERWFAGGEAAP